VFYLISLVTTQKYFLQVEDKDNELFQTVMLNVSKTQEQPI